MKELNKIHIFLITFSICIGIVSSEIADKLYNFSYYRTPVFIGSFVGQMVLLSSFFLYNKYKK